MAAPQRKMLPAEDSLMTEPTDPIRTSDPTDETRATPPPPGVLPPPGAGSLNPVPAGSLTPPDPAEGALPPIESGEEGSDRPSAAAEPGNASEPPLRANPDRPAASDWREPPWFPAKKRDRRPSVAAVIVGLALIAIGIWFFIDKTLGIALPTIAWRSIWPVVLIVIGGLILVRSVVRRS